MDKKTEFYTLPYSLKQAVGARLIAKIVNGMIFIKIPDSIHLLTKYRGT